MSANLTPNTFGIFSRTSRIKAEVRLEIWGSKNFEVKRVYNAIKWADATGRLHASADKMLRGLSGYQFAKLVIRLAEAEGIKTDQDVCKYLRGEITSLGTLTVRGLEAKAS